MHRSVRALLALISSITFAPPASAQTGTSGLEPEGGDRFVRPSHQVVAGIRLGLTTAIGCSRGGALSH